MPTIEVMISGKVQGVYFRASAREKAEALGVKGWIRNTAEGAVQAKVSGTDEQLYDFIRWCRQGPAGAHVTDVAVNTVAEELFHSFSIIR